MSLPVLRNPNPPSWFGSYRVPAQENLDNFYQHGMNLDPHPDGPRMSVDAFNVAAKAWLDDQTAKRALDPDPVNFKPEPFTKPFPRREIVDWDDAKGVYTWLAEVDPNIHAPVLPAFAPTTAMPGFGLIPSADPWNAMVTALLSQILAKVSK